MSLCAISSKCHCRLHACAMLVFVVCCLYKCFALALDAVWPLSRTTFTLTLSFCCFVCHRSLARTRALALLFCYLFVQMYIIPLAMLVRLALCLGKCMRTCNWCVVVVVFGAVACQLFDYLTLLCLGSRTRSSAEAFASIVEID